MTLSTDIIDRLARSLKPFWNYTQNDVIGDAMAEITKLRADRDAARTDALRSMCEVNDLRFERDAAARDMRERCAKVADERAEEYRSEAADERHDSATRSLCNAISERLKGTASRIRALPDTPAPIPHQQNITQEKT